MCGIAGILGKPDRMLLEKMRDSMFHRGPDDAGLYISGPIGLAARRLAILDIEHGHQPISNEDASAWVVQNGEIYNSPEIRDELTRKGHRFKTHCDTEVLIHAYEEWGETFLTRLRGMFALAIWDGRQAKLMIARDRLGIKPLYIWRTTKRIAFSSELRGLLQIPDVSRDISPQGIHHYLTLQGIPPPFTILRDVEALPAAEYRVFQIDSASGQISEQRRPKYWNVGDYIGKPTPGVSSFQNAVSLVHSALSESVKYHLLSDVPVGVFLSGGLDSSLIVALMREHFSGDLLTLTVGWEGAGQETDERPVANSVARKFETHHTDILLSDENLLEDFWKIVASIDQPSFDGVNSYFVSKAAGAKVKVAMSGIGGDELFLGYGYVRILERLRRIERIFGVVPKQLFELLAGSWVKHSKSRRALRIRHLLGSPEAKKLANLGFAIFSPAEKKELELSVPFTNVQSTPSWITQQIVGDDFLDRMMSFGLNVYLQAPILRDIDVMSMANSLEVRVPFLDHKFVETSAGIPSRWKYAGGEGKVILRALAKELLPQGVLAPKRGFVLPMDLWLRGRLRSIVEEMLSPDAVRRRGLFHPKVVSRMTADFFAGKLPFARVWSLTLLEAWLGKLGSV